MANAAIERIPFVDLFCGAGGLSVGFEGAGFDPLFANDNDANAAETYALNHPACQVSSANVEDITADLIQEQAGSRHIPLVVGGPNCQGVSLRGKRDPADPKNAMFFHFHRLIGDLQPDWFVMENVPGLLHRHNNELVTDIFRSFNELGYNCGGEVLLAADYGVPQLRYRFIMIGNRVGAPIAFPRATHRHTLQFTDRNQPELFGEADDRPVWVSVSDAIADLPVIPNGGGAEVMPYPPAGPNLSEYQLLMRGTSDRVFNHVAHRSSDNNIDLIRHIPPGKNWKSIPPSLRPKRFDFVALKDHTTTYGRLHPEMPARTITTYFNNISSGAFTHPAQERGISVREGARLQSFPDEFRFVGPLAKQYRQVGNAVPCLLAFFVAEVIRETIQTGKPPLDAHPPAIEFSEAGNGLHISKPLKGMRFNLDEHLVRS
jgi:DNA (cytosine-5)-methyltransferase 1